MEWYRKSYSGTAQAATSYSVSFDSYSTNYDEDHSIAESEEGNSVVESLFTQSSKGSGTRNEASAEERSMSLF